MLKKTLWTFCHLSLLLSFGAIVPSFVNAQPATPSERNSQENLYQQAYAEAVNGNFVQAIQLMSQISAEAPDYEQAQMKIAQWKKILIARGSSYEKELAKIEYEDAYYWANKGHFVRGVYEMQKISSASPFYKQAQQKITLWTRIAEAKGPKLALALQQYRQAFEQAVNLSQTQNLSEAYQAFQAIKEDSPYHPEAQLYLKQIAAQRAIASEKSDDALKAEDTNPSEKPFPAQTQPVSVLDAALPVWEISLIHRYGISLGQEITPGAGLGVSWYPLTTVGVHLEGNAFFSEHFLSWFVPLTLRFSPLQGENWRTYMGFGGFAVFVDEQVPLGALLELGADWWLTPHFGLGAGLDYGLSFSPEMSQTLGLSLQMKLGF